MSKSESVIVATVPVQPAKALEPNREQGKPLAKAAKVQGRFQQTEALSAFDKSAQTALARAQLSKSPVASVAAKGGPLTKVRLRQKYLPAYTLDLGYALLETEKQEHTVAPLAIYTSSSS